MNKKLVYLPDGTVMAQDDGRLDGHTTEEKITIIQAHLDDAELLTQLAEEAAELAKAALKLRRAITGKNPTPVSKAEALSALAEEIADVDICCLCLRFADDLTSDRQFYESKLNRWAGRLEEGETNANRR